MSISAGCVSAAAKRCGKRLRAAGVQPLLAGTTGPQAGGWFRKEIKSLADLNGLKMRAGGFGGEVLKGIGVDAILTPPGEIAAAMASGKLDAVEWNGPWNDREAGLHKLAPFYYMPGVLEIGPMLEASINKRVFANLSQIYRRSDPPRSHRLSFRNLRRLHLS